MDGISQKDVKPSPTRVWFSEFASWSAEAMGSPVAFVIATVSVLMWAFAGPLFNYSDTWQLVINTATTVLTFLAVFLIQHSQNRDGRAIQLKLDELIHSTRQAHNRMIDIESCTDEELEELRREFARLRLEPDDVSRKTPEASGGKLA